MPDDFDKEFGPLGSAPAADFDKEFPAPEPGPNSPATLEDYREFAQHVFGSTSPGGLNLDTLYGVVPGKKPPQHRIEDWTKGLHSELGMAGIPEGLTRGQLAEMRPADVSFREKAELTRQEFHKGALAVSIHGMSALGEAVGGEFGGALKEFSRRTTENIEAGGIDRERYAMVRRAVESTKGGRFLLGAARLAGELPVLASAAPKAGAARPSFGVSRAGSAGVPLAPGGAAGTLGVYGGLTGGVEGAGHGVIFGKLIGNMTKPLQRVFKKSGDSPRVLREFIGRGIEAGAFVTAGEGMRLIENEWQKAPRRNLSFEEVAHNALLGAMLGRQIPEGQARAIARSVRNVRGEAVLPEGAKIPKGPGRLEIHEAGAAKEAAVREGARDIETGTVDRIPQTEVVSEGRLEAARRGEDIRQRAPERVDEGVNVEAGFQPVERARQEGLIVGEAEPAVRKLEKAGAEPFNSHVDPVTGEGSALGVTKSGEVVRATSRDKPRETTSTRNAVRDLERRARGEEQVEPTERRPLEVARAEAEAAFEKNQDAGHDLIRDIQEGRARSSDTNEFILSIHKTNLHRALDRAEADGIAAESARDLDAIASARDRMSSLRSALNAADAATGQSGTDPARAMRARQADMRRDYSLEKVQQRVREAQDFKPLSSQQRSLVENMARRIEQAEGKIERLKEKVARAESLKASSKVTQPRTETGNKFGAKNKVFTRESRDAARKKIESLWKGRGTLRSGPGELVAELVKEYTKVIGYYVEAGLRSASAIRKRFIKEMGERAAPYFDRAYAEARALFADQLHKETVEKISKGLRDGKPLMEMSRQVNDLMEGLAKGGELEGVPKRQQLDRLVEATQEILQEIDPRITRTEIHEAFTEHGKQRKLNPERAKIRELKRQSRYLLKIRDLKAGQEPPAAERDAESQIVKEYREQLNRIRRARGPTEKDKQRILKSMLTRIQNRTKQLEAAVKARDPSAVKAKRGRVTEDTPEITQARIELDKAREAADKMIYEVELQNRPALKKIVDTGIITPLHTSRAIISAADLSPVLRQAVFHALGHPIRTAKQIPAALRSFKSEAEFRKAEREIRNDPAFHRSKRVVEYTEPGRGPRHQEEVFMSRWLGRIPTALGGGIVRGSNRFFVHFLNRVRLDAFKSLEETMTRTGEATPQELRAIGEYINASTGRGNTPESMANALAGLNAVFWAPRLVVSRFELLFAPLMAPFGRGLMGGKMKGRARKVIAAEYARFLRGLATVYVLAEIAGAEIEDDPRSSDFGKIRFGTTRVDPLGGLSQTAVISTRLALGESKSTSSGEIKSLRADEAPFGGSTRFSTLTRFLRNKLAPAVGAAVNVGEGENVIGEKVTPWTLARDLTVPLAMRDVYESLRAQGVPEGAAIGLLAIFGMGVQDFEPRKKKSRRRRRRPER